MSVDIGTVNLAGTADKVNRKLSRQQQDVLCYLFSLCREREDYFLLEREGTHKNLVDPLRKLRSRRNRHGGSAPGGGGCYPCVSWCPSHFLKRTPTRSESASLSRCLKRLYERRLIEYGKWSRSGLRPQAKELKIEQAGRKLAASFLCVVDPYPTEEDYQLAYYPDLTIDEIKEMKTRGREAFIASMERIASMIPRRSKPHRIMSTVTP